MRALVLGGSNFIGRTLVDRLLSDGHTVTLLNRGSRQVQGVEQLIADRNHAEQMRGALASREFDRVFDISCYNAIQANAALSALGGRFTSWMYLSTAAVYPGGTSTRLGEDEVGPGREWEEYGRHKLAAERALQQHIPSARHLVMLRAPYVYGPRNSLPREAWLWARILQHRPVWMPGDGATLLHFVHVDDVVDAMSVTTARALSAVDIFNVAQRETPSIRDYLMLLADVLGETPQIRSVDYRRLELQPRDFFPFRDFQCLLSTARIEETHHWRARYDMRAGLTQTLSTLNRRSLHAMDASTAVEHRLLA